MPTPFVCDRYGSHLHGPRRAAVGVAVKPPDESFHRLKIAFPERSLTLSLRILCTILILGEGCLTDAVTGSQPRTLPRT